MEKMLAIICRIEDKHIEECWDSKRITMCAEKTTNTMLPKINHIRERPIAKPL